VGGRRNGDGVFQRVQPKFTASVQDCGEARFGLFPGNRAEVKPDLSHPLPLHCLHKGATHLVAGRKISLRKVRHRAATEVIDKNTTLPADRFRNQETRGIVET
jgi:hypothetical protein